MGSRSTSSLSSAEYDCLRALLQETRVGAGVSQQGLSLKIKRPRTFIGKVESGIRRLDVIEMLEVLAALEVDPAEFITELTKRSRKTP